MLSADQTSGRRWCWLSLGATVRNTNTPSNCLVGFDREYTVGLGLRPLGERVSVGVDWLVGEKAALDQEVACNTP